LIVELADLLRDPDDDAMRLVYADALLAAGDPRGELIIVQHRLRDRKDVSLRARERDLITMLAPGGAATELLWRLGFIESATLGVMTEHGPLPAIGESLDVVLTHPSAVLLRSLGLRYGPHAEWVQRMVRLGERPALRELVVGDEPVRAALGSFGALWPLCPSLKYIRLEGVEVLLGEEPWWPEVRRFELDVDVIKGADVRALANAHWPKLEHLYVDISVVRFGGEEVTDGDLNALGEALADGAPDLKVLQLVGASAVAVLASELAAHPRLLRRLEILDVSTHISHADLYSIVALHDDLTSLKTLVAMGCPDAAFARRLRDAFRHCEVVTE
jgi:uncharacterized protein (TIGR02996 family)